MKKQSFFLDKLAVIGSLYLLIVSKLLMFILLLFTFPFVGIVAMVQSPAKFLAWAKEFKSTYIDWI